MKLIPHSGKNESEKNPYHAISAIVGRSRGSWQLWIGIVFSVVFFVLALQGVDLKETIKALHSVNILILSAAACCFVISVAAKTIRWQLLLTGRRSPMFGRTFLILSIGLMVNAFLPARLGEFARAYLMGEAEVDSKVYVLGTIALEKVADILFLLISFLPLFFWIKIPEWLIVPARGTALVLIVLMLCLVFLIWQRDFILRLFEWTSHFFPISWQEWLIQQARSGLASLDIVRRPRLMMNLFGWSLIVWALSALTNGLVFEAMKITMPFWASLLLLVVLQAGTAVPSSPGRIGVFQYLVVLCLSLFTLDRNLALGYSIALYLVIYVPIAILGIWGLWHEKITWVKLTKATVRFSEGDRSE
jgi:uncharacterized protein (TIRG00374 family)